MEMMKAAVVEKPDILTIKQVPIPTIGDNEVLIKVKYTGICGTDWSIYKGLYSSDKLPLIAGYELKSNDKLVKVFVSTEISERRIL